MDLLAVLLWAAVILFIAASVSPKRYAYSLAAVGWVVFGLRWGLATPEYYLVEHNIMYTVACALAIPVTVYAAWLLLKYKRDTLLVVTKAAAISSLFYFPFSMVPWLGDALIDFTTGITLGAINLLGFGAVREGFNMIRLNGFPVEIILACTAIQSIALFIGIVGCVDTKRDRQLMAFLITVPVIYLLNLVRNVFVVASYGNQWFQIIPDTIVSWTGELPSYASFFWAHNVFAETGSIIALIAISYAVISIMPETLGYIRDIFYLIRIDTVKKAIRGEPLKSVSELKVTPVQKTS